MSSRFYIMSAKGDNFCDLLFAILRTISIGSKFVSCKVDPFSEGSRNHFESLKAPSLKESTLQETSGSQRKIILTF